MRVYRDDVEKTRNAVQEMVEKRRSDLEKKVSNAEINYQNALNALEKRREELDGMREVEAFAGWSLKLWEKNLKDAEEARERGDSTSLQIAQNSLARHEKGLNKVEIGWSKFRDTSWDFVWSKMQESVE